MNKERKQAIVFGLDGTVADNTKRLSLRDGTTSGDAKYRDALAKDDPVEASVKLIQALIWYRHMRDHAIEIVFNTDYPTKMRHVIQEWIEKNVGVYNTPIYCRGQMSLAVPSTAVKRSNLNRIKREYDVLMAFDGDPETADMYTVMGVTCMQPKLEKRDATETRS